MTYSDHTIFDLKRAFYKFSRQIGKYRQVDALEVLRQLQLRPEAHQIIEKLIRDTFEKDAFAGYLRMDALAIPLEILLLENNVKLS